MNEKEKYIKIPLIKSVESIKRIENGELHDFDVIYYNDINNSYNIDTNSLSNLLVDHNILVDDSHPLYLYLPMELNDQIYIGIRPKYLAGYLQGENPF